MRFDPSHTLHVEPGPYPPGETAADYTSCDACNGPLDRPCLVDQCEIVGCEIHGDRTECNDCGTKVCAGHLNHYGRCADCVALDDDGEWSQT